MGISSETWWRPGAIPRFRMSAEWAISPSLTRTSEPRGAGRPTPLASVWPRSSFTAALEPPANFTM
ncbi:MAG: hypothetical protein ABSF83_14315 [Nitrososphaerales archaeon]